MATIFLDRDGVINEVRPGYVMSWSEFHFLPGAREAIALLTRAGHRIIVCTNQAGIARGHMPVEAVETIHRFMLSEVALLGGHIEKVYFCPHAKDAHCACRKPRPGLLLRAHDELGVDMQDAVFIGDSISDVCAGLAAGVRAMLVLTGLGVEQLRERRHEATGPFTVQDSLHHAAHALLQSSLAHLTVQAV